MVRHEMRYCNICGSMFGVSTSENKSPMTIMVFVTTLYSWMDMGIYYHGFGDRVAQNLRCNNVV